MNRTTPDIADSEAVWRPDVTVATIVPRAGRFLLVEETVRGELVLNQPAGHLESGESLQSAACRETLEETGWKVELTGLVGVYQWTHTGTDSHFVRFTFAARAIDHDPARPLDAGITRAVWLSRDEVAAQSLRLRSPMVLRGIDDFLAGRHLPLDAVVLLSFAGDAR